MKSKKVCAIGLACLVALSATGCSTEQKSGNETKVTSSFETKDMKLDTNVMAVGEEEVTLNEMLFYVYQLKGTYDGSLTSDVWKFQWNDEQSIEGYAKDEMVKEIAQIKVICQQAEKQNCQLTEEEANEAAVEAASYVDGLTDSAKDYHLTKELVEKVYKEHALAKKMYDVVAGTVDTNIEDSEKMTDKEKEAVIKKREQQAFKKSYAKWKKEYEIVVSTPLMDQISFDK